MDSDDATSTAETEMEQSVHELPRSRRSVLALGVSGLAAGIAGCSSVVNETPTATGASESSVFTDISFEGQQMVVGLVEGHSVERLNLIGPTGERISGTTVAKGESTATLSILDLTSGDPSHYTPGIANLVGVTAESTEETKVKLQPSLAITDASQYGEDRERDFGNVSLSIKNTGTAPTWVYNIYFEGFPNEEANSKTANMGNPLLDLIEPESKEKTILQPGEEREFVSYEPPLISTDSLDCNSDSIRGRGFVKVPNLEAKSTTLEATLSGDQVKVGQSSTYDRFTCSDISLRIVEGDGSNG